MKRIEIKAPKQLNEVAIQLDGSKSLSNRALIINHLCNNQLKIEGLSHAQDTRLLQKALQSKNSTIDIGAAGTSFRFLTALLSITPGIWTLTGSPRLCERPVAELVEALKALGADIRYLKNEGFAPLEIRGKQLLGGEVRLNANISSQFISALALIGPSLKNGLIIHLNQKPVSKTYLEMTLSLMQRFGATIKRTTNSIGIAGNGYKAGKISIEADWSAASYYFSIAAIFPGQPFELKGLNQKSLQGDSILPKLYLPLGVQSTFEEGVLKLEGKKDQPTISTLQLNFNLWPDLAQTIITSCALLGVNGIFNGLETLKIKETDRTLALKLELAKLGVDFREGKKDIWHLETKNWRAQKAIISTYEDHRMAMAFAPLCTKTGSLIIENPKVVNKSYPNFWDDLKRLGFMIESVD